MLPSPRTSDTNGAGHHGDGGMDLRTAVAEIPLLPTPAAERGGRNKSASDGAAIRWGLDYIDRLLPTPTTRDPKGGNQRGDDTCLTGALMLPSAVNLLPTPTAQDSAQSGGGYNGQSNVTLTDATIRQPARWGEYEPAIRRWESLTRPAPEPTKPNAKGNPKLSDEFDEWLMGYPAGWITDVPGVTWNEALKACGNGVVPQQGVAAIRWLLDFGKATA